jgi:GT2 family glycosyltransferase
MMASRWGGRTAVALLATATAVATAGLLHARRNSKLLRHLAATPPTTTTEPVAVLVPARDEASHITGCIESLRQQQGIANLRVRVLDDDSNDNTAQLARQAAADDPRIEIERGTGDPPAGWLGKPWACHRLAANNDSSVVVFVDADVRLAPAAVAAAVTELRRRDLQLLSAWPQQQAEAPLARLLQPLQQWSWLTTLPLDLAESRPDPSLAAANGQFLILDTAAYHAIGGHAAVRGEVLDDIELARAVKRHGYRAGLMDASSVAHCLMYTSNREVVAGYSKSLWRAFGGPKRGLAVAAGLVAVYVLPLAGLASRSWRLRALAATSYLAGVANRTVAAQATGGRGWPDVALHPLSVTAFAALTTVSVAQHRRGTNTWRGRPVTPQPVSD